ncbi:hypothetical protein QTP70_021971 [Hemibagrus guttatus]|uniref:E3 ubiquitin-protein ligase RNF138 n=1 Tax=Hemibagrus guttatus TaxID=175788 RepID=A0AAE0URR8_9TELE|nr:hypothetical protein QTP70_021971 [Hemibagrus guttatus]KAK3542156.1 hypothetical protein QTP86_016439 [Hemibagrus guttatus]
MNSSMDDDCPVCQGPLQNPSQPVPCCKKVFCHSCLRQAILARPCCPYCRTPINDTAALAFRSAVRTYGLPGNGALLQTTRTVSPNIQTLLTRLNASARTSQATSAPNVGPLTLNTGVQPTAYSTLRTRPVPRPRRQVNIQAAPAAVITPAPNPVSIPVNTSPPPSLQFDDLDDMNWEDVQTDEMDTGSLSGYILRTYNCPYCQLGNLDELDLRDHCNNNHLYDSRQVVCPVCVSLPHGNPTYCSRDFIGHLNLRHSYYIADITNVHQTDYVNLQDAIIRSVQQS